MATEVQLVVDKGTRLESARLFSEELLGGLGQGGCLAPPAPLASRVGAEAGCREQLTRLAAGLIRRKRAQRTKGHALACDPTSAAIWPILDDPGSCARCRDAEPKPLQVGVIVDRRFVA